MERLLLCVNTVELKQFNYQKSLELEASWPFITVASEVEVIRSLKLGFDTNHFVENFLK